jgi:hypothetical protein
VQILESTELAGLRSAVWPFHHRETPLTFVLFPMVHVAEASFFREVEGRLRSCQLVVEEGVRGGAAAAGESLRSYNLVDWHEQLGLTVQDVDPEAMGIPTIRPDFSRTEFDQRWRDVPWKERAVLRASASVSSVWMRYFGTRRLLAEFLELNDLPARGEIAVDDPFEDLVVDQRDRRLVEALEDIHRGRAADPIQVGVLYGAGHMRAVIHKLWSLGYRPGKGTWLTVLTWSE